MEFWVRFIENSYVVACETLLCTCVVVQMFTDQEIAAYNGNLFALRKTYLEKRTEDITLLYSVFGHIFDIPMDNLS